MPDPSNQDEFEATLSLHDVPLKEAEEDNNVYKRVQKEVEKKYAQTKADGGGLRLDTGKNRLELIPPEWVWALGDISTQGSVKYAPRNWERGMAWSKMIGCSLRHLYKFMAGERYDPETGCHHLAMAAWNMLALMVYDIRDIGEDDLPKSVSMGMLEAVNANTVSPRTYDEPMSQTFEDLPTAPQIGDDETPF
jgi:hypothetical protein